MGRVQVDGKQFALDGSRFAFRGVTYGTFRPRSDGARFPERDVLKQDLARISESGFTVLRTYTAPPEDLLDLASDWELRVLAGVFYPDWRYLVGGSRRQLQRVAREARAEVRSTARRLSGTESVLALSLGNEIPADVVRWYGTRQIADVLASLAETAREEDPEALVTYANYPTAEYLPLAELDFVTFNVFLERRHDFHRYLTRLHHLAGDRPLVLGEVGLHAGDGPDGEQRQADFLDWQLETALDRGVAGTCVFSWTDEWWVGDAAVEGWRFGLTREDRTPRPSLEVASRWNTCTVADLRDDAGWPSISVVVCAYNAAATLDECLVHTCTLDYPNLEIIVVDDGSTDDTAAIARRHPRARLLTIPHAGLSVARNEGARAAGGKIVAYLDSDAYPTPEWPYYLALGFDSREVGGAGGPNVPPPQDPIGAQQVARAPGGPVHVLVADNRAEHVPGCNMAFLKHVLEDVGGFDPVYTSAGDDVDMCWKVLDRGWEIGFHPAALVWHHRRPGIRPYLKQQRGYGRAEALVEARHPDRFTRAGTARWHGRIYDSFAPSLARQRVYRGTFGSAAYQSVYHAPGHALDIAHQVGVPALLAIILMAPIALLAPSFGVIPAAALLTLLGLGAADAARTVPPRHLRRGRFRFRVGVATLHLLQPAVRLWGRMRSTGSARRDHDPAVALLGPMTRVDRHTLLLPADKSRAEIAGLVVSALRGAGLRATVTTGWEDYDARFRASAFLAADLVTSAHPEGAIQLRMRRRLRLGSIVAAVLAVAATGVINLFLAGILAAVMLADGIRGIERTGRHFRRTIAKAAR